MKDSTSEGSRSREHKPRPVLVERLAHANCYQVYVQIPSSELGSAAAVELRPRAVVCSLPDQTSSK